MAYGAVRVKFGLAKRRETDMKKIKAHPEATAAPPDKNLHIDKRLPGLLEDLAGGHPDELRDTVMTAAWLGVSTMFLIKGRMEGYGPKYIRVGANAVRYRAPTSSRGSKSAPSADTPTRPGASRRKRRHDPRICEVETGGE
jgi:hypothetical protein